MSSAWTFENALHQLQHWMVTTWHEKFRNGQTIAISIQLRDETQDRTRACSAPDRAISGAPKAVNNYCQGILDEQWTASKATFKCDQLDFYLKERYESRNGQRTHPALPCRFSCRCHGGVSNILIPFKHGEKDVWYVFFGQFLLKSEYPEIHNVLMLEESIEPVTSILQTENGYLQENVFVDETLYKSYFKGEISLVSVTDFLAFKTYVLHTFNKFLTDVYSNPEKCRSLEHYRRQVSAANLLILSDSLKSDVRSHHSLIAHEKEKLILKIEHIERVVNSKTVNEDTIALYTDWIKLGHKGSITNQAWRNHTVTVVA